MPTARELLEQADALMRRNRQEALRPSSMPAVPPAVEQHSPAVDPPPRIVEQAQPTAAPVPHVTSDVPVAPPAGEDIPLLEDAIEALADDDVPVLTDAIDEIEVAAPVIDEGEPSDWLTPPSEDESVLGPSPPSVVLVPPAITATPMMRTDPAPATPRTPPVAPRVEPPPELEDFHPQPVDPDVTVRRMVPMLGAPVIAERAPPPEIEDLAETGTTDLDADVTWQRPMRPAALVPAAVADTHSDSTPAPTLPVAEETDEAPAVAAQRALPAGEDREALAEEIRMQVLQRIDMFTDTGLRERLGERLKPIVDRASADLVDAINQHVGEILRAYVAEAIEREIDRWRSGR